MEQVEQQLFENLQVKTPPQSNEVEISLFGKGFGEALVVHVGDGRYIIVDSFINPTTKNPVAEDYLNSLGVSMDNVVMIISTHWHSDHVAGLYKLFTQCKNAKFVTYPIISQAKFNTFLELGHTYTEKSSTEEFSRILQKMLDDKKSPMLAIHNKLIYNKNASDRLSKTKEHSKAKS